MYYSNIKTNRLLGTEKANTSNGLVSFKMRYTIDKNGIIYELTNFVYSPNSGGGVGGTANYKGNPFEQESLKINGVYGIIPAITKNKKVWAEIKSDWYKKMEILSSHFQSYVINYYATINQSSPNSFTNSHISYDVYKKIQSGMSYEGVIKLLGDEGKELSNNIIKKENKEVSEQIIVWYVSEDSRDKYIKLTLINKVVTSKSQANL